MRETQQRQQPVLIADDESHVRKLLAMIIARLGYHNIHLAENGEEALKLYYKIKPNLILLDINMPHLTGIEFLNQISGSNQRQTIIVLTSMNAKNKVEECIKAGAKGYILKNDDIHVIARTIKQTIGI